MSSTGGSALAVANDNRAVAPTVIAVAAVFHPRIASLLVSPIRWGPVGRAQGAAASLPEVEAAVHVDDLAGDVAGRWGGEEGHRAGDVLVGAGAAHRDPLDHRREGLGRRVQLVEAVVDHAGGHTVAVDPLTSGTVRQRAG